MEREFFGLIRTNENCVGCNKCLRSCVCPGALVARQNEDGKNVVDVDYKKCIGCGSCFDVCVQDAREFQDDTEAFFADLKKGEKISLLLAPSFYSNYPNECKEVLAGLQELGVSHLLNVSFGADISVWGYINYIKEYNFVGGIAQPCPTVVNYIERYSPELIEKLFPIQSPMMCSAIYARNEMNITDKLAFVGPCISKKDEQVSKRGKGLISYNVTFANLMKYVREHNIKGDVKNHHVEYGLGSIFPQSGGLGENILFYLGDEYLTRHAEGEKNMYNYMQKNKDCIINKSHPYLLFDPLNCSLGCCYGTASENDVDNFEDRLIQLALMKQNLKKSEKMVSAKLLTPEERLAELNKTFSHLKLDDYMCEYTDFSETVKLIIPTEKELESIYYDMNKLTVEDKHLDCACCGLDTCEAMAVAIHNKINYKENCVYFIRDEVLKERDKAKKAEIYHELAMKDIQTGLFNRNAYYEWNKSVDNFDGCSIVMYDLNNLKKCNDTYGHDYGDLYIKEAVNIIRKEFDDMGRSYRFGGDEFVTIIENTDIDFLENKIKIMKNKLSNTKLVSVNIQTGIAIGYAIFDGEIDSNFSDTEKRADMVMYENKLLSKAVKTK